MNAKRLTVLLLVISGCGYINADNSISGVQSDYSVGTGGTGRFYCDNKSLINAAGLMMVGVESGWMSYGTSITVELGSEMYVGHQGDQNVYEGWRYTGAGMINSSFRLTHNSINRYHPYTRATVVPSTVQLDNSNQFIREFSTYSTYQTSLQLQDSTFSTGDSNDINLQGSKIVMTTSGVYLGDLNNLTTQGNTVLIMTDSQIHTGGLNTIDLQGATLTMTSSTFTTGKGSEIHMAPKSLLQANPLNLLMGDHSSFSMGSGANLYSVGSNSSITIGERAKLTVVGICLFQGNLVIPDYTIESVGQASFPTGFTCMPTLSALRAFMSQMSA